MAVTDMSRFGSGLIERLCTVHAIGEPLLVVANDGTRVQIHRKDLSSPTHFITIPISIACPPLQSHPERQPSLCKRLQT